MYAEAHDALLAADVVCPHDDADGLAAGALALRARGEDADAAWLLGPGQTPWGDDPDLPDASVALLDQGVRRFARTGVLIDHHAPETDDPGEGVVVVSSFGEEPEVPTAPLVARILGETSWLATVGAVGDLAEPARGPFRKLVPLVNAPRRIRDGPVRTALALLVDSESPQAALADPRIGELEAARSEYRQAFEGAVRTRPQFFGDVAVLRFAAPFKIHGLVAQSWSRRLAPRPVLAANDGWLEGRVHFSIRGGAPDTDLRALLRSALDTWTGELGNGHPRATGGSLPTDEFEALLEGLAR